MVTSFENTVIFALILQFVQPSLSQTTRPEFLAHPAVMINYVTKNICTSKDFLPTSVLQQKPSVSGLYLELHRKCQLVKCSLTHSKRLWLHETFSKYEKTVIFAGGWSNKYLGILVIETMARPFLCQRNVNFVSINFNDYIESINGSFTRDYHNEIAGSLSKALQELTKVTPVENIHLIGYSLGAHIVSAAARLFRLNTTLSIPRVTGLDPSAPCYKDFGMQMFDASFTDVIHTNPYELGKWEPLGDVDFYVGGLKPNQPGCQTASCSSHRAWQYFVETAYAGGNGSFVGTHCRNWQELVAGHCTGTLKAVMGYSTPTTTLKGLYLVPVNEKPPYGLQTTPVVNKHCWKGHCDYTQEWQYLTD